MRLRQARLPAGMGLGDRFLEDPVEVCGVVGWCCCRDGHLRGDGFGDCNRCGRRRWNWCCNCSRLNCSRLWCFHGFRSRNRRSGNCCLDHRLRQCRRPTGGRIRAAIIAAVDLHKELRCRTRFGQNVVLLAQFGPIHRNALHSQLAQSMPERGHAVGTLAVE